MAKTKIRTSQCGGSKDYALQSAKSMMTDGFKNFKQKKEALGPDAERLIHSKNWGYEVIIPKRK
jgi:hypothetical protein